MTLSGKTTNGEHNDIPRSALRRVKFITRENAPDDMESIICEFETRFKRTFVTLTEFPEDVLDNLHKMPGTFDSNNLTNMTATINSETYPDMYGYIKVMSRIANASDITKRMNIEFFDAVKDIYAAGEAQMKELAEDPATLCLGPEREGRIIAEAFDCLPTGRSIKPYAKRMPYRSGIVVGLDLRKPNKNFDRCLIIDGAIASGSTIMSIMESLKSDIGVFHIHAAHCTQSSLKALSAYADYAGIHLHINVGHVSGALNEKRYALYEDGSLVIGDLGDLISPALDNQ